MNRTLLETYNYKVDNRTVKIQIFQVKDEGFNPMFYAIANYKHIVCEGNTIEEVKNKCEREIDIRAAIASGKIRIINSEKAEEIAKRIFKQFLSGYVIPVGLEKRLGVGSSQKGKEWVFDIYLYPEIESTGGLEEDLTGPMPDILAVVKVDGETQDAIVIENKEIMLKVFK